MLFKKVISLGPNERKPPPVNPSVAVKQETPEICENSEICENPENDPPKPGPPSGTPTIVLPKIGSKMGGTTQKRPPKVILAQNIMFSPKKQGAFQPAETGKHNEANQLNALDMLELPVVKQEPQEYNRLFQKLAKFLKKNFQTQQNLTNQRTSSRFLKF